MMKIQNLVLLVFVAICLSGASATGCGPLSAPTASGTNYTSICAYVLAESNVALNVSTCSAADDNLMASITAFTSALSDSCADAMIRYICTILHPPCGTPVPLPPLSVCDALNVTSPTSQCTGPFDAAVLQMINQTLQQYSVPYAMCHQFSAVQYKTPPSPLLHFTKASMAIPSCTTYTGTSVCAGIVNYPVYLAQGSTQQITQAEQLVNAFSFLNNIVQSSCANNFQKLICYTAFPKCQNILEQSRNPFAAVLVAAGVVVPVASAPTMSLCNNVLASCGNTPPAQGNVPYAALWMGPLGLTQLCSSTYTSTRGCNGTQPITASTVPAFLPSSGYATQSGLVLYPVDPNNTATARAYISCPSPLVVPDDPNAPTLAGGSCALPCPTWFFFPDGFWTQKLDPTLLTVGAISVVLLLVSLILFVLNRNHTTLPLINLFLFLILMGLWAPAALHVNPKNSFGAFAGAICEDNSQANQSGRCIGGAVLVFWAGLIASTLWLVVTIEVAYSAWFPLDVPKAQFKQLKIAMLVIVFTWSTAALIANGAQNELGSDGGGNPVCFMVDENTAYYRYFVPNTAISCMGVVMMLIGFVGVHQNATKAADTQRFFSFYARSVAFVAIYLTITVLWTGYVTSENNKSDRYTDETTAYITCLLSGHPSSVLQNAQNPQIPVLDCSTLRPSRDAGLQLFITFLLFGYGIWFFPVFVRPGDFTRAWGSATSFWRSSESKVLNKTASRASLHSKQGGSASNVNQGGISAIQEEGAGGGEDEMARSSSKVGIKSPSQEMTSV